MTLVRVLTVTIKAILREDRPDVAIEFENGRLGSGTVLNRRQESEPLKKKRHEVPKRPSRRLTFRLHVRFHPGSPLIFQGLGDSRYAV